ncbi:small ubiquitin-related modifier 2-A-like [Patiria miniata]|uniref:Ubiquitin-like domain-containing protein n=1 Tax=Patiria miniata TaxID=46514 RepID=A0A913ZXS4_PATMI|nr:small ubiquitin-related modifier 2-A-like [Patiria miniata]
MSEQVPKQSTDVKDKSNDQILVKVRGQDNSIIQFKIKKGTPFRKLMCAYCEKQGVQLDIMRFRFDGVAIGHNDTPRSIDIEDDDTIEAYMPQTGGQWSRH